MNFLYDDKNDVENVLPFDYFTYYGSHTQPPCAENVIWLIVNVDIPLSSTIISMFFDTLIDPENPTGLMTDSGNNRYQLLNFTKNYKIATEG